MIVVADDKWLFSRMLIRNPGEGPDMAHHVARKSRAVVFTQNHLEDNSEIKILALFA